MNLTTLEIQQNNKKQNISWRIYTGVFLKALVKYGRKFLD